MHTQFGPLENAGSNDWTSRRCTIQDGNKCSFRNFVFEKKLKRRTMSRISHIIVKRHVRNIQRCRLTVRVFCWCIHFWLCLFPVIVYTFDCASFLSLYTLLIVPLSCHCIHFWLCLFPVIRVHGVFETKTNALYYSACCFLTPDLHTFLLLCFIDLAESVCI
jgi:hypothetical protein